MGYCPYVPAKMPKRFKDLLSELKQRAESEGPELAEAYAAADRYFADVAGQLSALRLATT